MTNEVIIGTTVLGGGNPLLLIAGPCVIENKEITFHTAQKLKEICAELRMPFIFKSSYDKANRTSLSSFRCPGHGQGIEDSGGAKKQVPGAGFG